MRINLLRRSQRSALEDDVDEDDSDKVVLIPQGTPSKGKKELPAKPFLKELSFKGLDLGEEENTATTTAEQDDFSFPAFGSSTGEEAAAEEEPQDAADKESPNTHGTDSKSYGKMLREPSGRFFLSAHDDKGGDDDSADANDEEKKKKSKKSKEKPSERSSKKSSKGKKKGSSSSDSLSQSTHKKKKKSGPTRGVVRRYSLPTSTTRFEDDGIPPPSPGNSMRERTTSLVSPVTGRKKMGLGSLMRSQPAMHALEDDTPSLDLDNVALTRSEGDIPLDDHVPEGLIGEEKPPQRVASRAVSAESALPEIEAASKARRNRRRVKSDYKKKKSSKKDDPLATGTWHKSTSMKTRNASVSPSGPRRGSVSKHKRRPSFDFLGGRARSKSLDDSDPLESRSCHARTFAGDVFGGTGTGVLLDDNDDGDASSQEKSDQDEAPASTSKSGEKEKKSKSKKTKKSKSRSKSKIDSKNAIKGDDAVTKVSHDDVDNNMSFVQLDFADLGVAVS
mmetsp:Transcript_12745/g.27968  ORF Transcript_12745/g.27968 Transcript_12745/m.27968 type:complete len:505 (+) Transcript_12745:110-1624(+)|eukprot:CAMPEP_0168724968 /NCGR_PEP_ID=MMETSP0724-20121128/3907_1 /TAXON_ID=265536 /ORGANISM="Amphiprora sp., Strain CCMP467" /LENGTH=504 /DNA_ID=CAMNT_0008771729 /DNA_START=88 /DNA_END=1602 /DNA_ORIENTATION=+